MLKEIVKGVPVLGQAYGLTSTAMRVYNSASPLEALKLAGFEIAQECLPPQVKYPLKCTVFFAQVAIAASTGQPWALALAIGQARQIID